MKTEFKHLWIFLLTCCYYRVSPSQVMVFHPTQDISRIKQVVIYLVYQSGAKAREVAEMLGSRDECNIYYQKNKIAMLIEPGKGHDKKLKSDIDKLTILTTQP